MKKLTLMIMLLCMLTVHCAYGTAADEEDGGAKILYVFSYEGRFPEDREDVRLSDGFLCIDKTRLMRVYPLYSENEYNEGIDQALISDVWMQIPDSISSLEEAFMRAFRITFDDNTIDPNSRIWTPRTIEYVGNVHFGEVVSIADEYIEVSKAKRITEDNSETQKFYLTDETIHMFPFNIGSTIEIAYDTDYNIVTTIITH